MMQQVEQVFWMPFPVKQARQQLEQQGPTNNNHADKMYTCTQIGPQKQMNNK